MKGHYIFETIKQVRYYVTTKTRINFVLSLQQIIPAHTQMAEILHQTMPNRLFLADTFHRRAFGDNPTVEQLTECLSWSYPPVWARDNITNALFAP